MESQMHRHHHHEDDPHATGEGEKKSVLKKVKEKAKKIKDSIKKHGHGHDHDHRQISEEEDEEMMHDPEVHGAPMYESAVIRGTNLPIQTGFNLEKPTDKWEDRYKPNVQKEVYSSLKDEGGNPPTGPGKRGPELGTYDPAIVVEGVTSRPPGPEKTAPELGSYNPNVEDVVVSTRPTGSAKLGAEFGTYSPNFEDEGVNTRLGPGYMGHESGSYGSSIAQDQGVTARPGPAKTGSELGGYGSPDVEDQGVATKPGPGKLGPELGSYINPNIEGEGVTTRPSSLKDKRPERGRYGIDVKNQVYPNVEDRGSGKMETELGRPLKEAREPALNIPTWSSPYTVDVETADVVGMANVDEPMVKIGPLEGIEEDPHAPKNRAGKIPTSNYQSKVTDPTGEGDKEAEVSPLIGRLDNLHVHDEPQPKRVPEQKFYTGSHDQFAPQPTPVEDQFTPRSNPMTPSESLDSPKVYDLAYPESMPHDTIGEKISSATSVIADKAVAAKNVVASKLGYVGEHQETHHTSRKPVSESATEYAHKVAEKLAPVYEKVAGKGNAILSKVQGGGGAEEESGDTVSGETDKGVSVKEYLAVKLSPGDEDKALSEVITEALHKEGMEGEKLAAGTEDAAASLENKREGEDVAAASSESSGVGAMDRLKDAVGSWFGNSSEHGEEDVVGRRRRLQELGN